MIRQADLRKFLARERADFRRWKLLTDAQLETLRTQLPVQPPIWKKLTRVQRICFLIGAHEKRFFFLNDMGTGKTLLAIALALYFRKAGIVQRCLVLVKRRLNKGEWVRELRKHVPDEKYVVLKGATTAKWEALNASDAFFVIESFPGLPRMVCTLKGVKRKRGLVNKLVPRPSLVKKFQREFQALILDESTDLANKHALPFRVCNQLSKTADVVFPLTGTPFGRDPLLMWAQMFLVDRGYTLGETLGLFRAAFFIEKETPWTITYKFDGRKKKLLHSYLQNASIRFVADEADLPRLVEVPRFIRLPKETHAYYKEAQKQLQAAKGNKTLTKNIFLRMRQISSGFIGYKDDETGARAKFVFPSNPKLELLMGLVDELRGTPYKMIVFHDFIYSGNQIVKACKAEGIRAVLINGETKDTDAVRTQFEDDAKTRLLALNNSMAMGPNLQIARYGFFYESPVSVMMRTQAVRRYRRQHSSHKTVFLYDLIVRGTVDETILAFHREGREIMDAVLDGRLAT